MFVRERTYRLYLIVGSLHCTCAATAKQLRLNPDRKELCIQISGPRTHRVEVTVAELLLNIDVFIKDPLHSIYVHIDRDCALMNRKRIHGRSLCSGCVLIILVHLFISAAGRKR
jgi:hypothetical protein